MLVTTIPGIEGRPVSEYLGVVTAQGVLGVNAFKDVGAGMRNIFGGRAKSYENELASGVSDALAEMEQQAAQLGADAVVGVDIDYETVGNNMLISMANTLSDTVLSCHHDPGAPRSPIIRIQLPMLTPVWRRADYLFGGGRTSVGAARRCGLPALCAASGL